MLFTLTPWRLPSIAERFSDVDAPYPFAARQIGDRAGDAEDAGVAARRQPHCLCGLGEELAACIVGRGDRFQHGAVGFGIRPRRNISIARRLDGAGGGDAGSDFG